MKLAGHVYRHKDTMADMDLFWAPSQGKRSKGRPKMSFIDQLKKDTGYSDVNDIKNAMSDRRVWKSLCA